MIFHDPENAKDSKMTLVEFNANRIRAAYYLICRSGVIASSVEIGT